MRPHIRAIAAGLGLATALVALAPAAAQNGALSAREKLSSETRNKVHNRLTPLLSKYCGEACQIIGIEVLVDERLPEIDELGFEGLNNERSKRSFFVDRVNVNVQIDQRMTEANRAKLLNILNNHLQNYGVNTTINWVPVELPQIGQAASVAQLLRRRIKRDVESAINQVIQKYCPDSCVLSNVSVAGRLITPDEAKGVDERELVSAEVGHTILRLEQIGITVALDERLAEEERQNIIRLMQAKTQFVRPVSLNTSVSTFPESFSVKSARLAAESEDPYGLEKLRRMLTLFRDLAGTKEIISNSSSATESATDSSATQSESALSSSEGMDTFDWILYVGGVLLALTLIGGLMMARVAKINRDAKMMVHSVNEDREQRAAREAAEKKKKAEEEATSTPNEDKILQERMLRDRLKEELVQIFVANPKVAKETFARLLQEDGVAEASKYVAVFGKIVVFELLQDPALQRALYELSEYYHKTRFDFTLAEEVQLLRELKTKVTANEIRVLASKAIDQFDFLLKLDPAQVYDLLADESPQVQSIVLTQLSPRHRKSVFETFEGEPKMKLLQELCKADSIPKEYLFNVAMALSKKVVSKPEFDTQSLRASDVILELLEKAPLDEQRALMKNLLEANPESARAIKMKLVTIEMLPYLKDGHLLELVLGMEREELLNFLGASPDHIRELLLSRAPEELAESWEEELDNIAAVDDDKYRFAEIQILGRVRTLANNGALSILEINEMIFSKEELARAVHEDEESDVLPDSNNLVA